MNYKIELSEEQLRIMHDAITRTSLPPFNYALINNADSEVGYFKNYDCFYAHQMMVKRLGEIEDAIEQIEKIIAETHEEASTYIDDIGQDLGWKEAYFEIKDVIEQIKEPIDKYNYWNEVRE